MKENNKKFNNAMHKFVGVLDKYGVWERIIRSIREILRSLLGDQLTDDKTLLTFIADVEKVIKDRPLTPPTGDRNDFELLGSLSYKKSLRLALIRLPEVNV